MALQTVKKHGEMNKTACVDGEKWAQMVYFTYFVTYITHLILYRTKPNPNPNPNTNFMIVLTVRQSLIYVGTEHMWNSNQRRDL